MNELKLYGWTFGYDESFQAAADALYKQARNADAVQEMVDDPNFVLWAVVDGYKKSFFLLRKTDSYYEIRSRY